MSDDVKDVLHVKELLANNIDVKTLNVTERLELTPSTTAANGSANVTISNVAPSGVTTATITKWMVVKDEGGVTYFIPMWT